jgi:hypothetical protein
MANEQNLKPWKPGQSGNPTGKPKDIKHLSTWIQEFMEDENFTRTLANGRHKKEAPVKSIVSVLIHKAVDGDMKAFDLLAKYGYGTRVDITSKDQQLPMPLLGGISVISDPKRVASTNSRTVSSYRGTIPKKGWN